MDGSAYCSCKYCCFMRSSRACVHDGGSPIAIYFLPLLRSEIDLALDLASALDEAPQACKESRRRVGRPCESRSGPGEFPMRARKEARRGLSPDLTGGLRVPPVSALYDARPRSFRPPFGFWPSFLCHAGVLGIYLPFFIIRRACAMSALVSALEPSL